MKEEMFFQSFIDVDLWNNAGWAGTIYGWAENQPPFLGILFKNKESGEKIFDQWLERFGKKDEFEELNMSIVEGDIKGEPEGYSVLIGSDLLATRDRYKKEFGKELGSKYFVTMSRIHRMTPPAESKNLENFKLKFKEYNQYLLIPAYGDEQNPATIKPDFSRGIIKTKINFKTVDEIGENDIERAILKK